MATTEETRRSKLVPKWIRVFCWIFLVAGVLAPTLLAVGLFYTKPMQFGVFGWEHIGSPYDIFSLLVVVYFFGAGFAAFGLLWGKPWGLAAGLTVGLVGLALSIGSLVAHPLFVSNDGGYGINFRLEPLLQIPYLYALWRVRNSWNSENGETPEGMRWMGTEMSLLIVAALATFVGIVFAVVLHLTSDMGASGVARGKPHFEDIVVSDSELGNAVESFSTSTPVIYVHARKADIVNGSKITASWIAVDTNGAARPNYKILTKDFDDDLPANAVMYFSLSRPKKGWPAGTYRLDLTVDDEPTGSATFSVKAD